jgi:ornithine carbamoyltransferase
MDQLKRSFHEAKDKVMFTELTNLAADIVITDGWPSGTEAGGWSLTKAHLAQMGHPKLLPTPPFSIGRELSFDPSTYAGFVGYKQKTLLVQVQKAILCYAVEG